MAQISFNGKTYTGNTVEVKNNKVFVDGVEVNTGDDKKSFWSSLKSSEKKEFNFTIEGDVQNLNIDNGGYVIVKGNVGDVKMVSGNVEVEGYVQGNITTTSGDVEVHGDVSGNIKTVSGDVDVEGKASGSVNTVSGDIAC